MSGKLIIFSAPSGAGKSTIVQHLLQRDLNLEFSVSATSRPPRGLEKNGIDYYFLSPDEFRQRIENNEFIEHEEVYPDLYYGTLRSEIDKITEKGNNVIYDVFQPNSFFYPIHVSRRTSSHDWTKWAFSYSTVSRYL